MAGYPYTNQVTDDNAKKAIIAAFDRISVLTAAQDALQTAFTALSTVTVVTNPTTGVVTPVPPSGGTGLGSFNTGDLVVADTPSTLIGLPDVPTGNVLLAGGSGVRPFYGKIGLTTHVSGTLPVGNGGTNSAAALGGSTIMISNGSAIVQGAAGSTTTVLHGNAGGAPTYSAVSLTADVSGDLPFANLVPATAISVLIGRGAAAGAGDFQEITLGANLTMTGTVLSATGGSGSPGGSDTYIQFNDALAFGGVSTFTWNKTTLALSVDGSAVFNDSGADKDFRIEGDTNVNLFFLDASTDRIGIGLAAPLAQFHISGATTTPIRLTQTGTGDVNIRLERTAGTTSDWSIYSPTTSSDLRFFSGSDRVTFQAGGNVGIANNGPTKSFQVGSSLFTVDVSGIFVGIGTASPADSILDISGNAKILRLGGSSATGGYITFRDTNAGVSRGFMGWGSQVFTGAAISDLCIQSAGQLVFGTNGDNRYVTIGTGGNVGIGTATLPSLLTVNGLINTKNYTVATLPAGTRGDIAYVTDALAPAFLAVVVGGGAVVAPVFYNGANWVGF